MKKWIIVYVVVIFFSSIFIAFDKGKDKGYENAWRHYIKIVDPNYVFPDDPNYDPNKWTYEEPNSPILYIDNDLLRLQPGSSIKYIEIGDPNVEVSYFKSTYTDICIEVADINIPMIIKNCTFYTQPKDPNI